MSHLQSTAVALVGLVFVAGVALGSNLGCAAILHLLFPTHYFDAFQGLHNSFVVGVLFGLSVLWLLPPHPWAWKEAEGEPSNRRVFRSRAAA